MSDNVAIQILRKIKSTKGCKISAFENAVPEHYAAVDAPSHYFLKDPILRLMRWGLIQAFEGTRSVETDEIEKDDFPLRVLKFYLSPLAATLEDALDFDLVGTKSIFGEPKRSRNWPQV